MFNGRQFDDSQIANVNNLRKPRKHRSERVVKIKASVAYRSQNETNKNHDVRIITFLNKAEGVTYVVKFGTLKYLDKI